MNRSSVLSRLSSRAYGAAISTATFLLLLPARAFAQTQEWSTITTSSGTPCVYNDAIAGEVATLVGFECLVYNVLQVAVSFIGLAAFVMLLVGAFLYLTSGGNQKGISAAKQTFTYAILGIIVALLSWFVLRLIAGFTGIDRILDFSIYFNG